MSFIIYHLSSPSTPLGTVELISPHQLSVHSHLITYGNAATPELTELIRNEIETLWNEPQPSILLKKQPHSIRFVITAEYSPNLTPENIFDNTDPRNNYFRIETFALGNISFVDGLGCNTGYFKIENLYPGSTTAAHEYGHTLGLDHPRNLDLRGKGVPGIMYPRGTLVDPPYQYNPTAQAGDSNNGGTMHPRFRRVQSQDIQNLPWSRLQFSQSKAILGEFSSIWHPDHADLSTH